MGSGGSSPLQASRQDANRVLDVLREREGRQGRALEAPEGPTDSQGPSPYATLRRDAWWPQRPSAPSLPAGSSVRGSYVGNSEANAPQEETLLAYAAQMTGWQSGGASNLGSTRSEVTELSRTVSCLAAANQQLAVAHGAALAHLEALYQDVRSGRHLISECDKNFKPTEDEREDIEESRRGNRKRASRCRSLGSRHEDKEPQEEYCRRIRRESQLRLTEPRSRDGEKDDERRNDDSSEDKTTLRKALERIEELENTLICARLRSTCDKELQCDESEDFHRLKTENEIIERVNEELKQEVEIQRQEIERLKEENKASTEQSGRVERDLREEIDVLTRELDLSKAERGAALARISILEQDLKKSILDKDHAGIVEGQKFSKLRAQLAEEVADKKKQIKALETALEEIQILKLAVKTEKRDGGGAENESEYRTNSPTVLETVDEIPEDMAYTRATNMEEFKKELTLKREARQRAIAAVSSEMDRLRRELGAEKEAHSETSRMLDLLKSGEPMEERSGSVGTREDNSESETLTVLRNELQEEKEAHQETLRRITAQQIADTLKVSDEIRNFVRFEAEKLEDLRYHLERDTEKNERQISGVKEAVAAARLVLAARDKQVNKLKDQLAHILARLDGMNYIVIFDEARAEFDHQLENLRNLKTLYEVRLKILIEMQEHARKELIVTKERLEISQKKVKTLEEDLEKSEKVDVQDTEISNLESQLGLTKADCRDLENQMSVINSLFTQMLLSASSADMDLDRLTRLLQENHDLISDMAREEGTEAAALPKLLLDIVEQVEGRSPTKPRASSGEGAEKNEEDTLQEGNIAHNLPKVWRVLLELLSCHAVDVPSTSASAMSAPDSCYKSVDTPSGPQLVISVSKTYIRLKELILEKKHLEKEMTRMKQLNTHLESKLGEQEKRLSTVSSELSKTWNIVGRMQAQHQQLHTHEKILRYELQQKRKMLQELKQELEYCREKWESARQKNTNTEMEWKNLRREFAARKALAVRDSLNNSGESGFSDERGDESDEEDEGRTERIRISPRRRTRKESPRVPSPDTESEQPTDTEISESKTCSSETLEQRTPTPETETEVDQETIEIDPADAGEEPRPATPQPDCSPEVEILDPLDRALTNVIQSLIKIDTVSNPSSASTSRESIPGTSASTTFNEIPKKSSPRARDAREWSPHSEPWSSSKSDIKLTTLSLKKSSKPGASERSTSFDSLERIEGESESVPRSHSSLAGESGEDFLEAKANLSEEESTLGNEETLPKVSVFSIGPYPTSESPSPVKTVQFREPLILGPSEGSPSTSSAVGEKDEPGSAMSEESEQVETGAKSEDFNEDLQITESPDYLKSESINTIEETPKAVIEDKSETRRSPDKETENDVSPALLPAEPSPSTSASSSSSTAKASRTPEEVLAARAARLKRLEEQADWLMKKMNATSQRGSALSSRLEELHEAYGEPPAPPPLPDVLPSVRLQTNYEREEERDGRKVTEEAAAGSASEDVSSDEKAKTGKETNESPPDNAP